MPVRYLEDTAVLEDICSIEEAGDFADWLRAQPSAKVDLAGCRHMHTAYLQILMALQPHLATPPKDPALLDRLMPLLQAERLFPSANARSDDGRAPQPIGG